MADVIGERIEQRIKALGTSQSEIARRTGIKQPSIGRLITGVTRKTGHLMELARALETTPEYLTGETDDPSPAAIGDRRSSYHGPEPEASVPDGMVLVKEFDLALGLGGAYLDVPVEERQILFPADWLRQFSGTSPDLLHFVRGKGDSMYPTIMDGDICLLDTSRRRLDEQDALWAVAYGELGMIKRLRKLPDGTVKILSDNENVPAEVATDGELYLLGRCCGVFRKT